MLDLTGRKFGRLTAIKPSGKDSTNHTLWECECECGNHINVVTYSLTRGSTKSCGCIAKERAKRGDVRRKHGGCGTRLYRIWKNMKKRCNNPNNPDYIKWYGSRGIKVCDEWNESFECFRDWSLKHGYSEELTIDRIDVNGNYCPENCKWSTAKEQRQNRRDSLCVTATVSVQ